MPDSDEPAHRSHARGANWPLLLLAAVVAIAASSAVLEIGPPASSARTSHEVLTAEQGVIQSTVSGTGNLQPGADMETSFQAGGTLSNIDVKLGQHVRAGQLLATLDPTAAQLSLDQAQQNLTAADDQLVADENPTTTTASVAAPAAATTAVARATTPARTTPTRTTTPTATNPVRNATTTSSTTTTTPTPSPSAIAAARASVDSAELAVRSARTALAETSLRAPASGTVVSLSSAAPGDAISAGSSSSSTGTSGSAGSGGSGTASSAATSSASASTSGGLGSSGTSAASSTGFAEIVDTSRMTMTVAFSESDITKVRVGQTATVTLDALPGVELSAHVSAISTLGTTSSGVVSYNATLALDDNTSRARPGMSASASVITAQARGVNLPNSAITGSGSLSSVNVVTGGRTVSTPVVVGLRGDSRTQIVSGLSAGRQVALTITLPALGSSSTAGTAAAGGGGGVGARLGGAGGGFGGAGLGGGGFGGGRGLARAGGG